MKKNNFLLKIILIYLAFIIPGKTKELKYLDKGIEYYNQKEFDKSKIFFEKDLVFNPKSEKSYLYLAKIFNNKENEEEEEVNLNTVLLLNPQNDEAIYMLALIKMNNYDYEEAKSLIERFSRVCEDFCFKKEEIQEQFNKLSTNNETEKN
jgi:Tfp pilus assembly protein PilF